MWKFDSGHQFIEANSGILPQKNTLCEISLRISFFYEIHKIMEHLLMHLSSNLHPFGSLAIYFFQRILLLILEFIKVYIASLSFFCFFLREWSVLKIVKLNILSLLPRHIVKIFNSMSKLTLFLFIEAQSPEIEPAKWFLPLI